MKKALLSFFTLLIIFPAVGRAETKPFNASLFNPVQIVDESNDIRGLRFNLLYGRNQNVSGFDIGAGVGHSRQDFKGIGIHFGANFVQGNAKGLLIADGINIVTGNSSGLQAAAGNYVHKSFTGLQIGYANITKEELSGIQIGIFNKAGPFKGLQIGIVNIAEIESGLQIGIANINKNKKPLTFFPIVNFKF